MASKGFRNFAICIADADRQNANTRMPERQSRVLEIRAAPCGRCLFRLPIERVDIRAAQIPYANRRAVRSGPHPAEAQSRYACAGKIRELLDPAVFDAHTAPLGLIEVDIFAVSRPTRPGYIFRHKQPAGVSSYLV